MKVFYTVLILSILTGCALFKESAPMTVSNPLESAELLYSQGKYQEAIQVYRQILDDHPPTDAAAEAQFRIGYTLSYFQNPQPDYAKSIKEFQQVLNRFPKSKWAIEAKNWIAILSEMMNQRAENRRLQKDLQQLMMLDIESEKRRREIK